MRPELEMALLENGTLSASGASWEMACFCGVSWFADDDIFYVLFLIVFYSVDFVNKVQFCIAHCISLSLPLNTGVI